MLIAAIDTSFDESSGHYIIGILIASYEFILFLHKNLSRKIHRSYLHFRSMSKKEKNLILNEIKCYANKLRLIAIIIKKRKLTIEKRKSIAKFIGTVLHGIKVYHIYVCTDLDRKVKGTFILALTLSSRINVPITRSDDSIPIQIADLVLNYYRKGLKGLDVSVKFHNC